MSTVAIAYGETGSVLEADYLRSAGHDIAYVDLAAADHRLAEADALMVTVQGVTEATLQAMPRCRIIGRVGTGLDSSDLDAAARRGVYVTNVADYSVDEVSTHAVSLLLAHVRRLPQYLGIVGAGGWDSLGAGPIRRLAGTTLGVLGFGRIGQAIARKAIGLGMTVAAHDPLQSPEVVRATGAEPVGWDELLRAADYLTLHVPLTAQTRNIIDASALAAMKPRAVLINTARGGLVDEEALAAAVRSGTIGGALLDVLSVEPPPAGHPLLGLAEVWVTPHAAWYSGEAQHDVAMRAAEDVHRVLSGQPPRSPVNEPVLGVEVDSPGGAS
jgi:D-3-phosphoglycerate dehydrogenase / 2-oxoglutarate reductase